MSSTLVEADLRALADEADARLADASAAEIVAWAREQFGDGLVVASSMADTHLVHLAQAAAPGIDVLFLDTGYHFAETIGTRDAVAQAYQVNLISITPRQTVAEQDAEYGPKLHARSPDQCCALRKVEPLERGLKPYAAWINGMRREESPTRTDIRVADYDAKRNMIKISPIAAWTQGQVDAYIEDNQVLINPLFFDGYTSIGCEPCTRRPLPGEDPRAGRWAGFGKTECGLHA
ncbi:MAG TPA: phosphoadenylyl-sulfate reductase [Actinocrinis sp.]|jgi:phosphoadenosine phosphosulfate reductase|uniref:phosphoadenylyl-sulfate reductase n=1 Tax=Actinocrinis sp. TaxID=1920516 RepID=UPI002DDDA072|nr:phosphoadenylyl-sulfate reductase [Actinocrinis sp.]HEV3170346.1 phosphoadenylyl-sulfate reductase [Actinocrinis sp.]